MQALQELMAVYTDMISEAQEKGLARGLRKGRKLGLERGLERGLEQGRKEGREEGERAILVRLLIQRFGPLPRAAEARIRRANLVTLERWTDRLLTARTLDEVLD